jgi:pimeloyl-ACP methyl ester carboxylesterase
VDIILIPGFWLDGASWDDVAAPIRQAGHSVHALTLPGLESANADRSGIGLRDHVDAVIAVVDSLPDPVVLVGHSGGGAIAHAVVDARPDRVARVIYVDSGPLGDGAVINDELPVVNGEVPLPDWSVFEDADLVDLTDELRAKFRAMAIPTPVGVTSDKQVLSNDRRYDVPATVIACEFSTDTLRGWIDQGHRYVAELAAIKDVELVDLPTGHWPQLTRPRDLATMILAAVDR